MEITHKHKIVLEMSHRRQQVISKNRFFNSLNSLSKFNGNFLKQFKYSSGRLNWTLFKKIKDKTNWATGYFKYSTEFPLINSIPQNSRQ